jgi:hypothetical protein
MKLHPCVKLQLSVVLIFYQLTRKHYGEQTNNIRVKRI